MQDKQPIEIRLRSLRDQRGWSQEELARRSGASRSEISGIESGRLMPSVAVALALSRALDCRVEDLFATQRGDPQPIWAAPPHQPCRYWEAAVGGQTVLYPAGTVLADSFRHDGVWKGGLWEARSDQRATRTLVLATCDPMASLWAAELMQQSDVRLLIWPCSSREALRLLTAGLIHIAGVHLAKAGASTGHSPLVREHCGTGYSLLHLAHWEDGVALSQDDARVSMRSLASTGRRWVGREAGSGAYQCLQEVLGKSAPPGITAHSHHGVVEALRNGWADVGVCLRVCAEQAALVFRPVRTEVYDLCFRSELEADPRFHLLQGMLRNTRMRRLLNDVPGYQIVSDVEIEPVR